MTENIILCIHCSSRISNQSMFCDYCHKILPITNQNYFDLFNLESIFDIDIAVLETQFLTKLKLMHPDKFIYYSNLEKETATYNTSVLNRAFKTLQSPLKRAEYILHQKGYDIEKLASDNFIIPQTLLMESLEWRESLENTNNIKACSEIQNEIIKYEKLHFSFLAKYLLENLYDEALKEYVYIKFILRFKKEIDNKLEELS